MISPALYSPSQQWGDSKYKVSNTSCGPREVRQQREHPNAQKGPRFQWYAIVDRPVWKCSLSNTAKSPEGAGTCKTGGIVQRLLDGTAHYNCPLALPFKKNVIDLFSVDRREVMMRGTNRRFDLGTPTPALLWWAQRMAWSRSHKALCSPHVKDSPGICLNLDFNQNRMYVTPFVWLFC